MDHRIHGNSAAVCTMLMWLIWPMAAPLNCQATLVITAPATDALI